MDNTITPDEQPKQDVASHVVTRKRKYFEPHRDYVAEVAAKKQAADSTEVKEALTEEEEGDG